MIDGRMFCYGIALKDLSPLIEGSYTAHVHVSDAGRNGPRVIRLDGPLTVDPGASSDCVRLEAELARAISDNPEGYYVDIHDLAFAFWAARGQIFAVDPNE